MPYGSDITEPIPYALSNPAGSQSYAGSTVAYDVAFGGIPFFLSTSDESPYRRTTAQYRKQQIDMSREPGEQTITGWWLRSQSTFHLGQGVKFFEPAQDETLRYQYTYSKGLNIWEKGQATLLNDVDNYHYTEGNLQPNKRPFQITRSIRPNWTITNKALTSNVATLTIGSHLLTVGSTINVDNVDSTFNGTFVLTAVAATTISYALTATNVTSVASTGSVTQDAVLLWDKYDVDKIDIGGKLTHFLDYTAGVDEPVYSICDDGTYAYWITNRTQGGSSKIHVYKKALTGDSTTADTLMFFANGITATNAVIEFTKERLVMAVNNSIYEFATSATALPTAVYSHPNAFFTYTSITSSGAAIYLSGFNGIQSTIQKFTLSTSGSMPTLTSAITAAELPVGEVVYKIYYYLGFMAIGTNLGLRIAEVSVSDGSIAYGPLLFKTDQPVYDVAGYNQYLWAATGVDGNPGLTRVNLGQQVGTNLVFAYAWDLYDPTTTGFITTSCSFAGNTDRLVFCTANNGVANGKNYIETDTRLTPTGTMRTAFVRYNTLENKIFKFLQPRYESINGSLAIYSVDAYNNEYSIGYFDQGADITQIGISYPATPQQYLGFKFIMNRSTTDSNKGPLFTGYQIRVLPSVPRQRLIQYPVELYDHAMDKFSNPSGYENSAYDRLTTMQTLENLGDLIKVEDFRTGESYLGLIEEMDFINRTPTDKRYSGYGGLLLITIRTA